MAPGEVDRGHVLGADEFLKRERRAGRHEVILGGVDVEDRHGDVLQVDPPVAELHLSLYQFVLLVEVLDELAEGLTGLIGAVEDPLLHAEKALQTGLVLYGVDEPDILLRHELEGLEHQEPPVHEVPGDVPEGVDHGVHVQVLRPDVEQTVLGVEIHRGDHRDEVLHLPRVEGGIAERHRAALTNPQQVDLVQPVTLTDDIDAVVDVAVDVVVQGEVAVPSVDVTPVDQVQVETQIQQVLHHRAVMLDIDHVRPVDQGVDDQYGDRMRVLHLGRIVIKNGLVFLVDHFPRGWSAVYFFDVRDRLEAGEKLLIEVHELFESVFG